MYVFMDCVVSNYNPTTSTTNEGYFQRRRVIKPTGMPFRLPVRPVSDLLYRAILGP